jgi:hypothetical protein
MGAGVGLARGTRCFWNGLVSHYRWIQQQLASCTLIPGRCCQWEWSVGVVYALALSHCQQQGPVNNETYEPTMGRRELLLYITRAVPSARGPGLRYLNPSILAVVLKGSQTRNFVQVQSCGKPGQRAQGREAQSSREQSQRASSIRKG